MSRDITLRGHKAKMNENRTTSWGRERGQQKRDRERHLEIWPRDHVGLDNLASLHATAFVVLWLCNIIRCICSEQKRRFQQQYPDSGSDVIDDAMRRHWESLGDRDRHRYLQRARSAMAVERGRRRGLSQLSFRGLSHRPPVSAMAIFCKYRSLRSMCLVQAAKGAQVNA